MARLGTDILFDLKFAIRGLAGQPSFSAAVALTLALGLGLNATVFGMMDALLLRPFQFADYPRIVVLFESPKGTADRDQVAPGTFLEWRRQVQSVERLVAWEGWGATLGGRTEPERLQTFRVSPGFFEVLGVRTRLGRTFHPTEDQPGQARRVIIGYGLWTRRFGGDPHTVGTEVLVDGVPHTVVGVGPPGFDFPVGAEMWAPLAFTTERAADRQQRSLTVLGRLANAKSVADAGAELNLIAERLAAQYPDTHGERGATVRTLSAAFREDSAGALMAVLQVGAGLVLLVACANLAGLLLARANDRQREVAVRTALGASRIRVVRQLVTEIVVLALVAAVGALILANVGLEILRTSIPADMARYIEGWNNVRVDARLVWIMPLFAVLIGLFVGLIPSLSASRGNLTDALKEGDRRAAGGAAPQRARQVLVVGEIAFALTLLVSASLALNGGARLIAAPNGFDPRLLLTFNVPLPENRYGDADVRREFASNLLARLETIPGVRHAALATVLPAAGWSPSVPLLVEDAPVHDPARRPKTGFSAVSVDYLETVDIPIVRGRRFAMSDREDAQPVAIVSASLAARFWPGRNAIGRRLKVGDSGSSWLTIVGIAGDITMYNWWDGVDMSAVYVPLRQSPPSGTFAAVVRTRADPSLLTDTMRTAVASIDPLLALDNVRTMEQAIRASTFGLDLIARLLGICGAIALLLAIVGIYSMMAYAVSQRRHEFGIRMALGASPSDVLNLSLRRAGVLTAAGVGTGLALAAILGRLMSSALFGIVQLELTTFIWVTGVLAIVALAAAYVPALRSARLDPATILRSE
jgi:predicted permease